jgi:enoyl-CoA hydratase
MGSLVTYELEGSVATVTMNDGKVNVMSYAMQKEIHAALDRAEQDRATVLLRGRDGVFSAGFDLSVLRAGGSDALKMVKGGFQLCERVLSFPTPVVMACTGHAVAMGLFLLLSGDYLIGVCGPYKLTANEVAIGLTLPRSAMVVLGQRLSRSYLNRVAVISESFEPMQAVDAGLLDRAVDPDQILKASKEAAELVSALNMEAHMATKARIRSEALATLRSAIEADEAEFVTSA